MTLDATDLVAGYGDRRVLDGVSLRIAPGTIVGLSGPSGSGKSTLARVLTGLLRPWSGEIRIDGVPLVPRPGRLSGRVALVFQSPRLATNPRHSLRRIVAEPLLVRPRHAGASRPSRAVVADRVRESATLVGLTADLLDRLPGQVSDGQLQRAALARALVQRPDYLVCDEVTAMLDPVTSAVVAGVVTDQVRAGMGALVMSHDLALLRAWADDHVTLTQLSGPASAGRRRTDPGCPLLGDVRTAPVEVPPAG